jgi:hypothetical protein
MATQPGLIPAARPAAFDVVACLKVVTDDPAWVSKLLTATAVSLAGVLIVPIPLLLGYHLRLMRRAQAGEARPLPEWDDWGGLFGDGLRVLALVLPHQIAFLLVVLLPFVLVVTVSGALGGERGGALVALLVFPLVLLMLALALAFGVYLNATLVRLAAGGDLAAAYDPGANLAFVRRNVFNLLLAFIVLIVANFIAQFGILLCCIGLLPATVWSQLCFHYALGRAAALDPQRGR